MADNKPDVVAWRWRKPIVNDQGETIGTTAWELGDTPEFLTWWTNDPLIRISDYEALKAENEALRDQVTKLSEALQVAVDTPELGGGTWYDMAVAALAEKAGGENG